MKETSIVASAGAKGRSAGSSSRALRRSITVTRGSSRRRSVDLAVGDVDRGDPGGAALQQAVGEAAGGGADVEAVAPGGVDPERLERVLQLDPAAGDVARPRVDDQRRLRLDQLARPQRHRPVLADPDFAGPHRAGGGRARRKQPPLGQNRVYPGLLHAPNATASQQLTDPFTVHV